MNGGTLSIRPAKHTDFAPVCELMHGFMQQHHQWRPEQFQPQVLGFTQAIFQIHLEETYALYLVAETDEGVVGYAVAHRWQGTGTPYTFPRKGCHIGLIVVNPNHRRQGIGRALFGAIESWAEEFGAEYVGLNVESLNEAAKAFYDGVGYPVSAEYRLKTLRHVQRLIGSSTPVEHD